MFPIRVKTVQESDLRMLGSLARNIQRVLPVTQADIDAAAALGKGWVVWKVFEVSDPLDNMRGGTQLIIRQNSIQPGQNVRRVIFVSGPGGQTVVIRGGDYIVLPDAIANSLSYVKAFGGTEQRNLPSGYIEQQFIYMMDGSYLGVTNQSITSDYKIEFDFATTSLPASLANYFGARANGVAAGGGFRVTKLANQGVAMYGFDTTDAYESGANILTANTRYKYVYENGTCKLSSGGTDVLTHTYTVNDTSTITTFGINAYTANGTTFSASNLGIYCYGLKMWNGQGELVMNLVPVVQKGTVPVVGFYDTVSGTFRTATAGTFAAGGEAVPTPDAPMDIVSNNGVLKARRQSGLPWGYTLLDYITFGGAQYIDTGLAINNNTRVLFDVKRSTPSAQANYPWLGGARDYVNNTYINKKTLEFAKTDSTKLYLQYATSSEVSIAVPNTTQRHTYDFDNNKLYIDENLIYTATQETFIGNSTFLIGTVRSQDSVSPSMFYGDVYGFKLWQDGTNLSMNLIPAKRDSDNVVGMYDLVSGQFFTNAGTGTFTAGTAVSDPVEIYTDGTVETINVHTKNLFNKNSYTAINAYVNSNTGVLTQGSPGANTQYCAVIPCKPNTTYTISGRASSAWGAFTSSNIGTTATSYNKTVNGSITTGANDIYLIGLVRANSDAVDYRDTLQVEQGSTATAYQPYFDGGTATAEMLLKIGDYQDVQEILSGEVTRKVGVRVLDGTEGWVKVTSSTRYMFYLSANGDAIANNADTVCTIASGAVNSWAPTSDLVVVRSTKNFGFMNPSNMTSSSTVSDWTTYLTGQYNAGTPVIVVYPLATPTTESVAGQPLQVTDGDNIVEITQASLSGLELEVEYQAAVSLTIQEVQDANLDNNVTVTIQ